MKITSTISMLAVLVSAGAIMATGAAASGGSTLVIRHELKGCHAWSANGDAYKATQAIKLHAGEGVRARNRFLRLTASQKGALLKFLGSL